MLSGRLCLWVDWKLFTPSNSISQRLVHVAATAAGVSKAKSATVQSAYVGECCSKMAMMQLLMNQQTRKQCCLY